MRIDTPADVSWHDACGAIAGDRVEIILFELL